MTMVLRMPALPSPEPEIFEVNRPAFFVLIRKNVPLFIGNLVDPKTA